jgi:1-acyl-sn-glycerol-3-phosphate acyltransferase
MPISTNLAADAFDDIRPFQDEEVPAVMRRLARNDLLISTVRMILWPSCPRRWQPLADWGVRGLLAWKLGRIRSVTDFQRQIVGKRLMRWVVGRTISELTSSGLDSLGKGRSYIFISNHRDIVLDSALLNYVLYQNGHRVPYIAFGDNLLINELVGDLIRVNRAFIVKRDLPPKEQLKALQHLSAYIGRIRAEGNHFWIAQREGRSKDGNDLTNPAVIKMLYLAERKQTPFAEFIRTCNIVPVAVSYERDPCDRLKGWEVYRLQKKGVYHKRKNEDLISMAAGIAGHKGRVHLSFGPVLTEAYADEKQVAREIDRRIHEGYRLWPTNYVAADQLLAGNQYAESYTQSEVATFLSRYRHLPPAVRQVIYQTAANPLFNQERARTLD